MSEDEIELLLLIERNAALSTVPTSRTPGAALP